MTAVPVPSTDLRRRVAIALATTVAALAVPASAQALTYCVTPAAAPPGPAPARALPSCVTPAVGGCAQSFATKDRALEAADRHPGTDIVRVREGAATHDIQVPASATGGPKVSQPSAFDDITNF